MTFFAEHFGNQAEPIIAEVGASELYPDCQKILGRWKGSGTSTDDVCLTVLLSVFRFGQGDPPNGGPVFRFFGVLVSMAGPAAFSGYGGLADVKNPTAEGESLMADCRGDYYRLRFWISPGHEPDQLFFKLESADSAVKVVMSRAPDSGPLDLSCDTTGG